jgi:glycerophosphoryl diester phosphodiesterase
MHLPLPIMIPPVIAHRGASGYAPENTLAAFAQAKALGANWVEFDVMLTKDDEVIVIHDDTLERTSNGKGHVADFSYSELKKLDAGSWFQPKFSHEKIPNLRAVIELLNANQLNANIEIKTQIGKENLLVEKVIEQVDRHWQKNLPAPLFSSFSLPTLEIVRKISPHAALGFLMDEWINDWESICDRLNCVSVNVNHAILDAEKIHAIKATQRLLVPYTVNQVERAKELFALGVDAVFSDFPDKILTIF